MLHLTGDVPLGSVLTIASVLGTAILLGVRFGRFQQSMTDLLTAFGRHEQQDVDRFHDIGRRIDRIERMVDRRSERRDAGERA